MGLAIAAICIEIVRMAWEGIKNVTEYRLRRGESSSRQREIASLPIPNSFFPGKGRDPRFPAKLARTALVKGGASGKSVLRATAYML